MAMAALNRSSNFLPVLEYATECANHVQVEFRNIETFLNTCHHRILSLTKWRRRWRRYRSDLLRKHCLLTSPLGLISPLWLAFAMNLLLRPGCKLTRAMFFVEAVPQQGATPSSSGRRSSYMRVLELNAR
jgi:hypothetical protein